MYLQAADIKHVKHYKRLRVFGCNVIRVVKFCNRKLWWCQIRLSDDRKIDRNMSQEVKVMK